jgi:hypothetical protein
LADRTFADNGPFVRCAPLVARPVIRRGNGNFELWRRRGSADEWAYARDASSSAGTLSCAAILDDPNDVRRDDVSRRPLEAAVAVAGCGVTVRG